MQNAENAASMLNKARIILSVILIVRNNAIEFQTRSALKTAEKIVAFPQTFCVHF